MIDFVVFPKIARPELKMKEVNGMSLVPITYLDDKGFHTMYTVVEIKNVKAVNKDNAEIILSDVSHGSNDDDKTVCGKELNDHWFITNNTFDGVITCSKCIAKLKRR